MNTSAHLHLMPRPPWRKPRSQAHSAVNAARLETYWLISQRIVQELLLGLHKTRYDTHLINELPITLTADSGKGFSYVNPAFGIILCQRKDGTVVKYSVIKESQQLFAFNHQCRLPIEAVLIAEIEH